MKKNLTRFLCMILGITLATGMLPLSAFAADSAHTHTKDCYKLVCPLEETDGHTHTDECYTVSDKPVCGQEEHTHSDACYTDGELTCSVPEHTHTNACYKQLTCGEEERPSHKHTDACYELICIEGSDSKDDNSSQSGENPDASGDSGTDHNSGGSSDSDSSSDSDPDSVLPETEAPLADILGQDEDGNPLMYTTLFDANRRIISTNDPEETQDDYYQNGGTLDLGAAVYVRFRMPEILPHEGEEGAQENVTYYMEKLPTELTPAEKDQDGNPIINPSEPVTFFQQSGTVSAYGGIYGKNQRYQLKMFLEGLEEQIDVSGSFQYGANVDTSLTPGKTYDITYVPGGTVSFTVTPNRKPPEDAAYSTSLGGNQGGPTFYYWTASISKKSTSGTQTTNTQSDSEEADTDSDQKADESDTENTNLFPYRQMTLTTPDAAGVWVDENHFGIFNAYGDGTGPGFSIGLTYSDKDADGSTKSEYLTATSSDILKNENGVTVVRFTGTKNKVQVDMEFRRADAVQDTASVYQGKNAYITNTIHATISDGGDGEAQNIQAMTLYVPVITYDDYKITGSKLYNGTLTWSDGGDAPDLETTGSFMASYNGFSKPSISDNTYSPTDSYEFFPEKVYNNLNSNTTNYRGNYYWMEFDPAIENHTNANYYISNRSFLPGNSLISSDNRGNGNGQQSTFCTTNAGTFLTGMVGHLTNWEYIGTVSVAQVLGDDNLIANSCFAQYGSSTGDAKLQYQLKQVFANANGSGDLIVYRSSQPHSYGEYAYIIIDPNTYETAKRSYQNGWYEYVEGNGSAKPANWRIHIFNAPCTSMLTSSFQSLGGLISNDQNSGGSNIDQVKVGCGSYDSEALASNSSGYGFSRYQSSCMNSSWVGDNLIFWQFTFDASNWPSWRNGSFYVNAKENMVCRPSSYAVINGNQMDTNQLYIQNSSGGWDNLNTPSGSGGNSFTGATISDMTGDTTLTSSYYDRTCQFNYQADRDLTQYRNSENKITIGFFTQVTGSLNSDNQYTLDAELVAQNGDVSRFAGNNGDSFPTSCAGYSQQYPFKISATGRTGVPQLSKSGQIVENTNKPNATTANWRINTYNIPSYDTFNGPLFSYYSSSKYGYGNGYGGVLRITDQMQNSVTKDSTGKTVDGVNPAKYTHITSIGNSGFSISESSNGGGCGPVSYKNASGSYLDSSWEKYIDGTWVPTDQNHLWDADKPGIYRHILSTSNVNSESNPLAVYVYYAGNMADSVREKLGSDIYNLGSYPGDEAFSNSLVVEYRGLIRVNSVGSLTYTTELDNEALDEAANTATGKTDAQKLAAYYDTVLKNSASLGQWKTAGISPETQTIQKRISALLSIEKKASPASKTSLNDGYTSSYSLTITNGFSAAKEIRTEDYLTGFHNVERALNANGDPVPMKDGSYDVSGSGAGVKALRKHLNLKNITIDYVSPSASRTTIYKNGAFISDWASSTFALFSDEGYTSNQTASLFKAKFVNAKGNDIPAGAQFVISYDAELNMDEPLAGEEKSFRESDYYLGGGLEILNSAVASRPYTPITQNAAAVQALPSGDVDGNVLTVDCGGNVSSVYLIKNQLKKKNLSTSSDGSKSSWMYYTYTGTMGKKDVSFSLDDYLSYGIQNMTFTDSATGKTVKLSNVTDPTGKANLAALMEHLIEKNATFKNIKLYYTDTQPDSNGANLKNLEPIWDLGSFSFSGGTSVRSGSATASGLSDLTFGNTPSGSTKEWNGSSQYPDMKLTLTTSPASLGWSSEDPATLNHGHAGFSVAAKGLDYQKYLISTYDVEIDWDAVNKEAAKILGNCSVNGQLQNNLVDDAGGKESAVGNTVKIVDSSISKSCNTFNSKNGTASWSIGASTGSKIESKLEIRDTMSISLPADADARVQKAAEAATSIDPKSICVKQDSTTFIYKNGVYQDGWSEENLTVSAEGRQLRIVIQNSEEKTVLNKNKLIM